MEFTKVEKNGVICACVNGDAVVITDVQSAIDVLMSAKYDVGTQNIVIKKELIIDEFFVLSNGLAGEILQKYINYHSRIAVYGDYSRYTSKPLKDFIYEAIRGKIYFLLLHWKKQLIC